jgi:hypothetical protein
MLVIGTFDWPKTLGRGEFFCPYCELLKTYRHRRARLFLTFYFIPLLPIQSPREYVECSDCKNQFERSVLGDQLSGPIGNAADQVSLVVALTILLDATVTELEVRRSLQVVSLLGQTKITREQVGSLVQSIRQQQVTLANFLLVNRNLWNAEQRRALIQAIFLVSCVEGQISTTRMEGLLTAQRVFGMSEAEIEACVREAERMPID